MRKTAIVVLVLLALAALLGCRKVSSKGKEAVQKITFAYTTQPQSTLVHVALAKGYFAEEGLEIQPLVHSYGKAALQSLLEDKADFATVAETPIMFSVLKGEAFFVIANIEASNRNNAIVARKGAGIAAPKDLRGKRIGYTPATTSDFFLDSYLTTIGLTRQAIRPLPLKPEEMLAAMLGQKVDAVSTWNYPLTEIQRQLGANSVVFFDHEIYTETFNIVASQWMVEKNPDAVKGLLHALVKAEHFARAHPTVAQAIMAATTNTDEGLVREVWGAFRYRVQLDQTLLITLEDETRWAMKQKLTKRTDMPNYRSYLHPESLRSLRPEAVSLGR